MPDPYAKYGGKAAEEDPYAKYNTQAETPSFSARPEFPSKGWFKEHAYGLADKATNLLPTVGGVTGGILGFGAGTAAPGGGNVAGAIGGATLGGAAGESARQLSRRIIFPPSKGWSSGLPETSIDAAKEIGKEGLKQGAYEAGGQGLRMVGRVAAPKLAEAAVSPGKRLLKSVPEDVNIGKTILNETTAVRPKGVVKQLDTKIAGHSEAADEILRDAATSGKSVPLTPARELIASEKAAALKKNAPAYIKDVGKVEDQLAYQFGENGKPLTRTVEGTREGAGFMPVKVPVEPREVPVPLPDVVDPVRARQIRQGVDLEIGNWNPEAQSAIKPLQQRVYGAITGKIHEVVPEVVEHDQAMTNLIPAREAAWNTSFNPGLTRSTLERFARPTGALVGAGLGTEEGYRHGGVGGAIAGGLTGLVLPNAIASPTGLMTAARVANSSIPSQVVRSVIPAGEGLLKPAASKNKRPRNSEEEEE